MTLDGATSLTPISSFRATNATPGSLKILVVDDERVIRDYVTSLLEFEGNQIVTAENGVAALDCFHKEGADVILTDRSMPEMDGLELAATIKKSHPHVPVILMSGFIPRNLDLSLVDGVVEKPFGRAVLWHAIFSVLGRERQRCA